MTPGSPQPTGNDQAAGYRPLLDNGVDHLANEWPRPLQGVGRGGASHSPRYEFALPERRAGLAGPDDRQADPGPT